MRKALGLIETTGLAAAYEAADTALKTANVELIGYELSKGDGMVTVKISGNVGAVQAGIKSAQMAASLVSKVVACRVIPRPSQEIDKMIFSEETVLHGNSEEITPPLVEEVTTPTVEIIEEKLIENKQTKVDLNDQVSLVLEEVVNTTEAKKENTDAEVQLPLEELISRKVDDIISNKAEDENLVTCNICKDPLCSRLKGQPKRNCLKYFRNKK